MSYFLQAQVFFAKKEIYIITLLHAMEKIKDLHEWPFLKRTHIRRMDSPYKGPVMPRVCPCHDASMILWTENRKLNSFAPGRYGSNFKNVIFKHFAVSDI